MQTDSMTQIPNQTPCKHGEHRARLVLTARFQRRPGCGCLCGGLQLAVDPLRFRVGRELEAQPARVVNVGVQNVRERALTALPVHVGERFRNGRAHDRYCDTHSMWIFKITITLTICRRCLCVMLVERGQTVMWHNNLIGPGWLSQDRTVPRSPTHSHCPLCWDVSANVPHVLSSSAFQYEARLSSASAAHVKVSARVLPSTVRPSLHCALIWVPSVFVSLSWSARIVACRRIASFGFRQVSGSGQNEMHLKF
jgi:hypothetical protein